MDWSWVGGEVAAEIEWARADLAVDIRLSAIVRRIGFQYKIFPESETWVEFCAEVQSEVDRLVDCGRLVRYDWMIARSDRADYWKDFYQLVA